MTNHTEQRKYFRLSYKSKTVMPRLRLLNREFQISEISEQGMRIISRDPSLFSVDENVKGEVVLNSLDTNIQIEGTVLRAYGYEVVINLREGLSFKNMIAEQRYLRKHFPTVLPKQGKEEN